MTTASKQPIRQIAGTDRAAPAETTYSPSTYADVATPRRRFRCQPTTVCVPLVVTTGDSTRLHQATTGKGVKPLTH